MYVPLDEPVTVANIAAPTRRATETVHDRGAYLRRLSRFPSKPKVLLLEPFYPAEAAWGSVKVEQGFLPPLGTISIYRWLKDKGYDVEFVDTQFGDFTEASLRDLLREGRYDMVGLPLFTPTADHVFNTARLIRSVLPDCVIVYGGVHATSQSAETLEESPECDFIIRREGELTIVELIEALKAHRTDFSGIVGLTWRKAERTAVLNPDRQLLPDLDELPRGMFGDLDLSRYVPHPTQYVRLPNYPFVMQRGCPYPCTFCEAHVALGKKLRLLSPERVVEELKILKYEKGAKGIYFQDSTFTINREYITKVFRLMIKEGVNDLLWSCTTRTDRVDPELLAMMYDAGCRNILYGIESGNEQSLQVIRKGITVERQAQGVEWTHKAKITMTNSFIICLPGETEEMVANTIKYAIKLAAQMSLFYLPVPYPGSDLYHACKADGGLRPWDKWGDFLAIDFDNPIYVNPLIGKERMKYWYRQAFVEYYSSPRVWMSNLKALARNGGVRRYLRGFNALRALVARNPGRGLLPSRPQGATAA
ncbi:MAG: B12-binding domain-containing radical SAM protein [Elusimicrobiota bacterium]